MGVTGLTQNKLFRVKTLDPSNPYKVGYNGVLDVYNDDFGYTIVKYEIDDIIYKSYLPTTKPQNSIRDFTLNTSCLLYTSPSPRDRQKSRMPSSA